MSGIGPFPMHAILLAVAAFVGWLGARAWAGGRRDRPRGKAAAAIFFDALLVGLLAARIGYVLRWWPEYVAEPRSMLAIGDGGFALWAGLPAALLFACWRTRGDASALRRPALAGIALGMLAWFAANGVHHLLLNSAPPLPDVQLQALDGTPQNLTGYAGKPLVVNLWATWCPPCRREMPVLAHAQQAWPDIPIVLANQGEDADSVRAWIEHSGLELHDVLLDPHSQLMQATNTRGLPTTLFFDADGRLVHMHMGELTRAGLADTLRRRFAAEPAP